MRTLLALLLLVAAEASSQARLSVAQLVGFVSSSVKLKHPDRQVAEYLKSVKLSEKLDERTIEELQGMGAGTRTVAALKELASTSFNLPPPGPSPKLVIAPLLAPSPAEQAQVLEDARRYALNYVKSLPDFLCVQVTRRYADPSGLEIWRLMDTVTARLSYSEQREDYKVMLVNDRPTSLSLDSLGGTTSTGEFGSMMREVFEPETDTRFAWERWATLRGRRMHVFAYRVAQDKSGHSVSWQKQLTVVAGYRGLVYVDRDTSAVMRITLEVENLPASFPIQQASTVLDYDLTDISGRQYMLPLRAVVRMRSAKLLTRNDVEFRLYRKFGTDVTLTFTPDELPDEQTKEQPPK